MNSVRLKSLSLKYYWITPSGCKDIVSKFEFIAKTQFLYGLKYQKSTPSGSNCSNVSFKGDYYYY